MSMERCAAFIAIDWSDAKHDLCLLDVSTSTKESFILKHTPEDLEAWATALRTRFAAQKIAVCLEQSRGPPHLCALEPRFFIRNPIKPATLAKYREAFSPSRAKDDRRDAEYMLELLLRHRDRLKAWRPENAKTRTLPYVVEHRRRLVNDRTAESLFPSGFAVV
jgi:hypothetical protein